MIQVALLAITLFFTCARAGEYLENVSLEKTQTVLKLAQKRQSTNHFENIYNQVRSLKPIKGSNCEELFLNLYFSACFLDIQQRLHISPENLTDVLYRQMLAPLGGSPYTRLSAMELVNILSRVGGIFNSKTIRTSRDQLQTSFARLVTGQGRFKLKDHSTEEEQLKLIVELYRHYNLVDSDLRTASAQQKLQSLWDEIVGIESGKQIYGDKQTIHKIGCFIIAAYAGLSLKYELTQMDDVQKFLIKGGRLREHYATHFTEYFYGLTYKTVFGKSTEAYRKFQEQNTQHNTINTAQLNEQIRLLSENDTIPTLKDEINAMYGDFRATSNPKNFIASILGRLSTQNSLTPLKTFSSLLEHLLGDFKWSRMTKEVQGVWDEVNQSRSQDPLMIGLLSVLERKINRDKVVYPREKKINDPRYMAEKTQHQIEEEQRKAEEKRQAERQEQQRKVILRATGKPVHKVLPEKVRDVKLRKLWDNGIILVADVIEHLVKEFEEDLSRRTGALSLSENFARNLYEAFKGQDIMEIGETTSGKRCIKFPIKKVQLAYRALSLIIHPDRASTYTSEFQLLGSFQTMVTRLNENWMVVDLSSDPWNKADYEQAEAAKRAAYSSSFDPMEERWRAFFSKPSSFGGTGFGHRWA